MTAEVNILAKPHLYIFFTLQLDSMVESYINLHTSMQLLIVIIMS